MADKITFTNKTQTEINQNEITKMDNELKTLKDQNLQNVNLKKLNDKNLKEMKSLISSPK